MSNVLNSQPSLSRLDHSNYQEEAENLFSLSYTAEVYRANTKKEIPDWILHNLINTLDYQISELGIGTTINRLEKKKKIEIKSPKSKVTSGKSSSNLSKKIKPKAEEEGSSSNI